MRISDVEKQTGLSSKTIRFYESKGLLLVGRSNNSYRDYDELVVTKLKEIKILRQAGIGLSDIQLWHDQVISYTEMIDKRLYELRNEADTASEQINLCNILLSSGLDKTINEEYGNDFTETIQPQKEADTELIVGIDIGTTTISAAVISLKTGSAEATYTVNSNSAIVSPNTWEKTQDAGLILERVVKILDFLYRRFPGIKSIGFSGQMHGILYLDENSNAISPLYTWQDERASLGSPNVVSKIKELTGYTVPSGYGLATHYYNTIHGIVPTGTKMICTIMDYAAMKITGNKEPVIHSSNAASLGLYDSENKQFDKSALDKLGIDSDTLPKVYDNAKIIGYYKDIPVTIAIGDNQASFMGAVENPLTSALANYGTGSQISMLLTEGDEKKLKLNASVELRPFNDGCYLLCGSALCGGRAYAMLERFFRSYLSACGIPQKEQYETINSLALKGLTKNADLKVVTSFCGTRDDLNASGSVLNITESNFTPENIAAGFVCGMADELYQMYSLMPHDRIKALVVSGNGARKNPALKKALSDIFALDLTEPKSMEEAAYGAAKFSAVASGYISSLYEPIHKD